MLNFNRIPRRKALPQGGIIFTARKWSLRRLWFLHVSVILSTGGVPGHVPPPGLGTPPNQVHIPARDQVHPPGQVQPRTRYTPDQVHPNPTPQDQVHPANQVHPPGRYTSPPGSSACWMIWATSGWYASYWNAFLWKMWVVCEETQVPGRPI